MTPSPPERQRYEYKAYRAMAVMSTDYPALEADLMARGEQGWEYCELYNGNCFIFKRPL